MIQIEFNRKKTKTTRIIWKKGEASCPSCDFNCCMQQYVIAMWKRTGAVQPTVYVLCYAVGSVLFFLLSNWCCCYLSIKVPQAIPQQKKRKSFSQVHSHIALHIQNVPFSFISPRNGVPSKYIRNIISSIRVHSHLLLMCYFLYWFLCLCWCTVVVSFFNFHPRLLYYV